MTFGEGRRAALHGPWPGPGDTSIAGIRAEFPEYSVWRAMADDRTPTEWCARHMGSGDEFTAETALDLAAVLAAHRSRS